MSEVLKLGICGICDKNQIWQREGRRVVLLPDYAEFSFVLSDQMVYRHAVCKPCILTLTDKKVLALIERIKATWLAEMVGWANDKQFAKVREKKLITYDTSEKAAIIKLNIENEKMHKQKLKDALKKAKEKK
jgi:hypothetical protein